MNATNRPQEPLSIARYTSMISFLLTLCAVGGMVFIAIWYFVSVGRVIVEILLAIIAFIGLFWNMYFTVSSIMKCFIPKKAFQSNTKYCSVIPENKPKHAEWMDVTIQIPGKYYTLTLVLQYPMYHLPLIWFPPLRFFELLLNSLSTLLFFHLFYQFFGQKSQSKNVYKSVVKTRSRYEIGTR